MENISKTKNLDFTQGSIWKKLIIFVLPILIGNLFQQLYLTVDAIVVGQYTGKAGLAAIDAVNSLIRLPTNFFCGFIHRLHDYNFPTLWKKRPGRTL